MKLVGHISNLVNLRQQILSKELHHAIMLYGPSGIGKKVLAYNATKSLFCENLRFDGTFCDECKSCILFEKGNHPDFFYFDPLLNTDGAAQSFRILLQGMQLSTFLGGNRVAIIDNADQLSSVSANIFLKSLEEPRANTYFFLISANPSKLPITIRSRSQGWRCSPLTDSEVQEILISKEFDNDQIADLINLADGSVEAALQIINQRQIIDLANKFVEEISAQRVDKTLEIISEIVKGKDKVINFIEILPRIVRRALMKNALSIQDGVSQGSVASRLSILLMDCETIIYAITKRHINPTLVLMDVSQRALDENQISQTALSSPLTL